MAQKSNETAMAVVLQAVAGTFDEPTASDYLLISNLRVQVSGVTLSNEEYTGSVVKNGPDVSGKRVTATFDAYIRPPAGADVPATDAFVLGRILQAAKMTEVRTTTAIPASAEAVAAGTNTSVTLSTGATGTADLYKGLALQLQDAGSSIKDQLTAIRAYTAGKVATLIEVLGSGPTANYQIPKQLSYLASIASADPDLMSQQWWLGGDRWDMRDVRVTGLRVPVPTTTSAQAQYPKLEISVEATIETIEAEAAPAITPGGAIPLFRSGKQWLAGKAVGGSNFTIDMGISAERPPNPNEDTGDEAPEIVEAVRSMSMSRLKYAKDVFDTMALADAQAQHGFFAQWGATAGQIVQIVVPDARFDYQNPNLGSTFVMEEGNLYIDAFDRAICFNFPYPAGVLS